MRQSFRRWYNVTDEKDDTHYDESSQRISAASSCENQKVIDGPRRDIILSDEVTHAWDRPVRPTTCMCNVVTGQDVTWRV